jgi:hypothetical protein
MKRFRDVLIVLLISTVICLGLATFIDGPFELAGPTLQTLTNVVTIFSSIILLSTAVVVYRKFSGSQAIVDKQTEKIVEFLSFMNTLNFSVEVMGEDRANYYNLHINDYKQRRRSFISDNKTDLRTYKNVYNYTLFGMFHKFDDYSRDPYLPKIVAARIKLRLSNNHSRVLVPPKNKLFIVSVRGNFKDSKPITIDKNEPREDSVSLYQTINDTIFELEDLMYNLEVVHRAAFSWLHQNNKTISDSLNVNGVEHFDAKKDIR